MGKFKKFKAEFKEQSLLEKLRIIFVSILLVVAVLVVGCVAFYFVCNGANEILLRHRVRKEQPISDSYSLRSYKDGSYQLVVTENRRKIGPRFSTMRDDIILTDSVIILYGEKGCQTFSLKTGAFSEELFDNIENPDPLHHLAACSRKGLLGFVDVHSGKLVIPLKFCCIDDYSADILTDYPHPRWGGSSLLDYEEADINIVEKMPACESCCEGACMIEEESSEPDYDYRSWRQKDSKDGTVQFSGDYCIVPTTISTYGVIDTNGNVLFDGYETISHYTACNLFKAYKNKKYDLYAGNGKRLLSQRKKICVLPEGIFHPDAGILTNHTCTDTLTDLVMRGYRYRLDEFGYGEYNCIYCGPCDYYVVSVTMDDDDADADGAWWRHNTKFGVIEKKSGKTVIEPVWDDVDIYTNGKGDFVFQCQEDKYYFLLDKNGKFLNRK